MLLTWPMLNAGTPVDCFLNSDRVLTIATSTPWKTSITACIDSWWRLHTAVKTASTCWSRLANPV